MTAKLTVVRVLVYEYDTAERMVRDMAMWTPDFNSGGVDGGMRMRSMHLPVRFEETSEEVRDDRQA